MLPDPLPILPWTQPCQGEVRLPGSKSLTNRALVIAALGQGKVRLQGALFSRDTRIMTTILAQLGFKVVCNEAESWIEIEGQGGHIPVAEAHLHVGNAGTAARFLTAFVCLRQGGRYYFDGDEEMRARPMLGLIEALQKQGAKFTYHGEEGCFPFEVETSGLSGGEWKVDASASSQMLSALMMVAQLARKPVSIHCPDVRPAFVRMTAGIMAQWGGNIEGSPGDGYSVQGGSPYATPGSGEFEIEPDVTAASYFMMLPRVVGGSIMIKGLRSGMLQGDSAFVSVAEDLGINVERAPSGWMFSATEISAMQPRTYDFRTFSDTFLTLAAVVPLLPFPVTIEGIGHTRFQETDRIRAMAAELQRIGARVEEGEASLTVHPFPEGFTPAPQPVDIQTYKDHRVAMSFAILACSSRFGGLKPWLRIVDPGCCGKTFPAFFDVLGKMYRKTHDK